MPITIYRRRGSSVWQARGSIKVGTETVTVERHSTGATSRKAAQEYADSLTSKLRDEILHGPSGRARHLKFDEVCLAYIDRPGGVPNGELWRLEQLSPFFEQKPVRDVPEGWKDFLAKRGKHLKPSTVQRYRATLMAALNHGCELHGVDPPTIPTIKVSAERVRFLTAPERKNLLASYSEHALPIALTLCYQGCRSDEALRLDWRHVSLRKGTLYFPETKNGHPRTVPMDHRVKAALVDLWKSRHSPIGGPVFLNRHGEPYSDSRTQKYRGGNPFRSAHDFACKRAGLSNFTPHDWRHDWACRAMMAGIDLETIKRLGGWRSIKALERYTAVTADHMATAMEKMP